MNAKGMHDIASAQTLINRSVPATRAQVMAQLARMEYERARLERELALWAGKRERTQSRLGKVQQHIGLLQQALDQAPGNAQGPIAETAPREGYGRKGPTWREISVEY
jgi:hypothetical protein